MRLSGVWLPYPTVRLLNAGIMMYILVQVLQQEVNYSPSREEEHALRKEKRYPVPQSPLLAVCWWRTVLDEAQQVRPSISSP